MSPTFRAVPYCAWVVPYRTVAPVTVVVHAEASVTTELLDQAAIVVTRFAPLGPAPTT